MPDIQSLRDAYTRKVAAKRLENDTALAQKWLKLRSTIHPLQRPKALSTARPYAERAGFVLWDGTHSVMPESVYPNTRVEVLFESGTRAVDEAAAIVWLNREGCDNVVFYKVAK